MIATNSTNKLTSGMALTTITDLIGQIAKRKSLYELYFKEVASARMLCVAFMVGVLVAIVGHGLYKSGWANKDRNGDGDNE